MATERIVRGDGADLWTVADGSGPALILGSGGPGCCDYLAPVAEMLQPFARVIRWEQRGCGRSTADGRYDLATTIADLEAVRVAYGVDRWIVGGHSWGADLALAYAWHFPQRTSGLLAISGGLFLRDKSWHEAYHAGRDRPGGEALPEFAFPPNLEVNRVLNASWREFTHGTELWKRALEIRGPALWVYAEHDIRPGWPERQLAALIPGGEFVSIAGAAHTIWLTHAEPLRAALQDWMRRRATPA